MAFTFTLPAPAREPVQDSATFVSMEKVLPATTWTCPPVSEPRLLELVTCKAPAEMLTAPETQPVAVSMTSVPAPSLVKLPAPLTTRVKFCEPVPTLTARLPSMPTVIPEVEGKVL